MRLSSRLAMLVLLMSIAATATAHAQVARLEARPSRIAVTAGDSVRLELSAFDSRGNAIGANVRVAAPRGALNTRGWYQHGHIKGLVAGEYELIVTTIGEDTPVELRIPVVVNWPPPARVEIRAAGPSLYEGTTLEHEARVFHADGTRRPDPSVRWRSSNPTVATVDRFGHVIAVGRGSVAIAAMVDDTEASVEYTVGSFPGAELRISGGLDSIRTGDVQQFEVTTIDGRGSRLADVPVTWSYTVQLGEGVVAPAAPAQVDDGRFVADVPGVYTVLASAGSLTARKSFEVTQRNVIRKVDVMGQGRIQDHYTSDIWVWEGVDGRDYGMTGSRQGMSHAYIWDITDPTNIFKTDSIITDARSVNDVKVSPDGRYGVVSREGASNRRNGVVILDLSHPAHPTIASTYDEGLTGGVHNVYATNDYLFALSGGDKYVILDMSDLTNPRYVSEYNHPNSRVHDVWVHDGIAYSAEWGTGVVVVDVGNGRWGGTIENPVFVTSFPLPTGQTHAVFPYHQESTGKFLLFVGDEIIGRRGLAWEGTGPDVRQPYDPETGRGGYPRATAGYIQIVDFTDPEDPKMIARYEVAEYGTHNMWVEDDILYQAYYEGGVRMVDVSGELMGNLYTQGREIAVFKAHDPIGWIHNAPAAWGVMPHKGNIWFSDNTSGIWSIRLQERQTLVP